MQKTIDTLAQDLELLLDVGFALRAVPEDDITRWLQGAECLGRPQNPHPGEITYLRQPTKGITKEYEVRTPSGAAYRLVVTPRTRQGVQSNEVSVRFSKEYHEGQNPDVGELVTSDDHTVLYLLPLVARLPLEQITYRSVVEFLEGHNGFKDEAVSTLEQTCFRDVYCQQRTEHCVEGPIELAQGKGSFEQKPYQPTTTEKVWMPVSITVQPLRRENKKHVILTLNIELPRK